MPSPPSQPPPSSWNCFCARDLGLFSVGASARSTGLTCPAFSSVCFRAHTSKGTCLRVRKCQKYVSYAAVSTCSPFLWAPLTSRSFIFMKRELVDTHSEFCETVLMLACFLLSYSCLLDNPTYPYTLGSCFGPCRQYTLGKERAKLPRIL